MTMSRARSGRTWEGIKTTGKKGRKGKRKESMKPTERAEVSGKDEEGGG